MRTPSPQSILSQEVILTQLRIMVRSAFLPVLLFILFLASETTLAQDTIVVRPIEIDAVLNNPGKGFTTFQRFNGDKLNEGRGWTEGFPIEYQAFDGNLQNEDYPATTIARRLDAHVSFRFLVLIFILRVHRIFVKELERTACSIH